MLVNEPHLAAISFLVGFLAGQKPSLLQSDGRRLSKTKLSYLVEMATVGAGEELNPPGVAAARPAQWRVPWKMRSEIEVMESKTRRTASMPMFYNLVSLVSGASRRCQSSSLLRERIETGTAAESFNFNAKPRH